MDEAVKEMCLTKYEEHKMIGLYTMHLNKMIIMNFIMNSITFIIILSLL